MKEYKSMQVDIRPGCYVIEFVPFGYHRDFPMSKYTIEQAIYEVVRDTIGIINISDVRQYIY